MQMRIRALPDSHGHSPPPTRIRTQVLNHQEGAANKEAPAEAPEPRKDNKEEVRVLIVEDHWANRRLLEAMLKKQVILREGGGGRRDIGLRDIADQCLWERSLNNHTHAIAQEGMRAHARTHKHTHNVQGPGFTMEAVENGQEAVNIADSRQYDIILMDCNMPIMDGWQATEKIRQTDVSRGGVRGCWMRA